MMSGSELCKDPQRKHQYSNTGKNARGMEWTWIVQEALKNGEVDELG